MAGRPVRMTLVVLTSITALLFAWYLLKHHSKHSHPNTQAGTQAAVEESLAADTKALASVRPLIPAPCEAEGTKARELAGSKPGSEEMAQANIDLLGCTLKISNEVRCKGKPEPCGQVPYNPPATPGQPPLPPKMVDVSVPQQVQDACATIGAAAGVATGADPKTAVVLGSIAGNYACGAWFIAASKDDPMLFVAPLLVPTAQLTRDLKALTGGTVDVTPEGAVATATQSVQRASLTVNVNGSNIPVVILPAIVPVGGTPGKVLDDTRDAIGKGVDHIAGEIGKALPHF